MSPSQQLEVGRLVESLVRGAALELYLTPKPGLVDLTDSGSHPDLSLSTMERSIHSIADYLLELFRSLSCGERFEHQVAIAKRAERNMLQARGTNTHRGYLFLSGLLLIAHWHARSPGERSLREAITSLAEDFFNTYGEKGTNGRQARERYRAGGIVREALAGFPSLFLTALPVFRSTMERCNCFRSASFAMLARLMQTVEDTTTLHRGGPFALSRIRRDGRVLERIISTGGDYVSFLAGLNRLYILKGITMGGVADMLGLSYGYLLFCNEIALSDEPVHISSGTLCHLDELSLLIRTRPESAAWFSDSPAAGLQYRVPRNSLHEEALFEALQAVRCTAW
jgi:triphosphoribosyl-dephospho-CoA synthase